MASLSKGLFACVVKLSIKQLQRDMSGEFRAMIERFYRYANSSPYSKIYQEVLLDELDVLEEEPVHIISIPA